MVQVIDIQAIESVYFGVLENEYLMTPTMKGPKLERFDHEVNEFHLRGAFAGSNVFREFIESRKFLQLIVIENKRKHEHMQPSDHYPDANWRITSIVIDEV